MNPVDIASSLASCMDQLHVSFLDRVQSAHWSVQFRLVQFRSVTSLCTCRYAAPFSLSLSLRLSVVLYLLTSLTFTVIVVLTAHKIHVRSGQLDNFKV